MCHTKKHISKIQNEVRGLRPKFTTFIRTIFILLCKQRRPFNYHLRARENICSTDAIQVGLRFPNNQRERDKWVGGRGSI